MSVDGQAYYVCIRTGDNSAAEEQSCASALTKQEVFVVQRKTLEGRIWVWFEQEYFLFDVPLKKRKLSKLEEVTKKRWV